MKIINTWNDMEPFGIIPLTGEACGLSYRILCDVTAQGKTVLEKCFGTPNLNLPLSWNRGNQENPHVGCIMLTCEMLQPLAVFALLENGHQEVYLMGNFVLGREANDPEDAVETMRSVYKVDYVRQFRYGGTEGDRNVHSMSGRVV